MRYWIHRITRWALLLAVLLVALLILFRIRYHQVITDLSKTQIINSTSDLINDAVAAQIVQDGIAYDSIVYFEKDLNGRITALKTNIGLVNKSQYATTFVHF